MAAHPQNDGRPAARHNGGSEAEGNDEGAVAGQRPAVAGDGGAAEQSGQQPEADPREQPEERNPAGEAPIVRETPGCAFGHSGHGTEPTPRLPSRANASLYICIGDRPRAAGSVALLPEALQRGMPELERLDSARQVARREALFRKLRGSRAA